MSEEFTKEVFEKFAQEDSDARTQYHGAGLGMAFFVIHGNDPFAVKELAFIYLVVYVLMYIIGPGKFAVDHWLGKALTPKKP